MKKKRDENLITWKIKYTCQGDFSEFIYQYNSLLKFTFNKLLDDVRLKTPDLNNIQKTANNCDLMNSWFRGSAEYQARAMIKASNGNSVIFGGRKLFIDRCQHKISRDEFLRRRVLPLYSIGEANQHGNRIFQILDNEHVLFKPTKGSKFLLILEKIGRNRLELFNRLIDLQSNSAIAITYSLDLEYIYITFDYNLLKQHDYRIKEDRVFAIDVNPNSIGWSVVDWKAENSYSIVQAGTISLKSLNDCKNQLKVASTDPKNLYITNKRNHEIIEIAKQLFDLCKHYHCEVFVIEQLTIPAKDNKKGRAYNRLVNNMWNRNLLINQLKKRVKSSSAKFVEVQPQWNSYIGNLVFRNEALPDECLASIEIGRRGFEFSTQYIFKRRPNKKVVIYPDLELVKNQLSISLEEIGIDVPSLDDWMSILQQVKKSKTKYRFSSSEARKQHSERLFSKFYRNKYTLIYEYL